MLLALANGNLAFRIPLDSQDEQFITIAHSLNEVAKKMQRADYLNPYQNFANPIVTVNDSLTAIILKVKEYILNHLEEALPSSKELAAMFGTNEFTLKANFRKELQTSIYQFYNDERLKKAHFLIQKTVIPLKEISFMCGFNDYTNFYKAFKKKYKFSPSELYRNIQDHDS